MNKKMINTTVLKSTDHQRVGIKEILSIENNDGSNGPKKPPISPHPGPTTGEGGNEGNDGTSNPKKPKSPRKSLDERIANALTIALKPVVNHLEHIDSRLDRLQTDVSDLKVRMTKVENRLDKQDEFNQYVRNVFERNNLK